MKKSYIAPLLVCLASSTLTYAQSTASMLRIACDGDNVRAEITVNGSFKGECPLDVSVPAGSVNIRALKRVDSLRERVFSDSFRVGEGVVKRVEVSLSPVQLNAEGQRIEAERRRAEAERQRLENEKRAAEAEAKRKAEAEQKAREAVRAAKIAELKRLAAIQAEERRKDREARTAEAFAAENLKAGTGTAFRDCADCPELVWIPPGKAVPVDGNQFIRWLTSITISAPFAIGKFEVTFEEWDRCVADGGCTYRPPSGFTEGVFFDTQWGRGRQPVINVSPKHLRQYLAWLSRKTGQQYRLLTLAESSYASYAGATTIWPWGTQLAAGVANCPGCGGISTGESPVAVGSFPANAWGVHDMIGNVSEQVADCIGSASVINSNIKTLDALERAIDVSKAPRDGRAIDNCRGDSPTYGHTGGTWSQDPFRIGNMRENDLGKVVGFRVARDYVPKPVVVDPVSLKPYRDCANCPEMVSLPAGRFEMGSPYDITGATDEREYPLRTVTVASFSIGKTEVTRGQYAAFVAATKHASAKFCAVADKDRTNISRMVVQTQDNSWLSPGFVQADNHPVVCVSKQDAQAYASWLTQTTGNRYRLPSEAEWEYAARAGAESPAPWGGERGNACQFSNARDEYFLINHDQKGSGCSDGWVFTAPAGLFLPNAWGLRDMLGNAAEFVEDCLSPNYVGAPSTASWQAATCEALNVNTRGGSWWHWPISATARRSGGNPGADRGFRVVRENAP
jgi:sulfatase modifying factor 1